MGEYKNKAYTLRIDNEIMEQIRQIAKIEDRTINKQIEHIAKEYINRHYKEKNNTININDNHGHINNF